MTPERLDHMTVQYVWALENDQVFMARAKHEVERGNFAQFRRLVGSFIMPIRKMLDEAQAHALSGTEWSFLYIELWHRLRGKPHDFSHSNNQAEYDYQMDRLAEGGCCLTRRGVERTVRNEITAQQTSGENTMNDNYAKSPCATATLRPAFETKSYIFGNDVEHMSEDALISAIKRVEEQIADLKAVKTKSTKIAANIAKLQDQLGSIVAELDKR
mgnify:CR=1 FL=1